MTEKHCKSPTFTEDLGLPKGIHLNSLVLAHRGKAARAADSYPKEMSLMAQIGSIAQ